VPTRAAIGKSAKRAAKAHQSKKHSGEGRTPRLVCIGGGAELSQAESKRIANDDRYQRDEARLRQRPEEGAAGARLDAPLTQRT